MTERVRDISLGDYTISVKQNNNDHYEAKLTSGKLGGQLELEKLENGRLRVKELDLGSAEVPTEYLALMLVMIEADEELVAEINKVREAREKL